MNNELYQNILNMLSKSRPMTKDEAKAHSRALEKRSTIVKCLYPEIKNDKSFYPFKG